MSNRKSLYLAILLILVILIAYIVSAYFLYYYILNQNIYNNNQNVHNNNDSQRPINPTAPNEQTMYLRGDFTDDDGDGMTNAAEMKYGYDPDDPSSFPQEPEYVEDIISNIKTNIPESGIGAYYTNESLGITIWWENPENGSYSLNLRNEDQTIYYGGHPTGSAPVIYTKYNLTGTEVLRGRFTEYNLSGSFVKEFPEFNIDLSCVIISRIAVGDNCNKISFTFENFTYQDESRYRDFLIRVWPIMYENLGAPAESFNCLINNVGDLGYFMSLKNGREFWCDGDFIPRLIVHEFVHAWKGRYTFSSDNHWKYDTALTGFEEASAEGMAFEIIHEYIRSYPNDTTSLQLLDWRPYQYWSSSTIDYDLKKHIRWTGAGDFWNPFIQETTGIRYSIAATTFQIFIKYDPDFYKKIMSKYFNKINSDQSWRPNREDIIGIWKEIVPKINGIDTENYLNSIPVFQGHELNEGIYVFNVARSYGWTGDQSFAVTYAISDGRAYWGILEDEIDNYNIPPWMKYDLGDDSYYYIDTQDQPFTIKIFKGNNLINTFQTKTEYDRRPDGTATGWGWKYMEELDSAYFPIGLYRENVTFTNYLPYDNNATEEFYFFGCEDLDQDPPKEIILMIGVEGVFDNGKISITIEGKSYEQSIVNGIAVFRSKLWPFDLEGEFPIRITDSSGTTHTYYRTLLEAGTLHGYFQHQFLILDENFNGIEDPFENLQRY